MQALLAKLPERYWIEINERLVPFGKFICTGERPRCSTCAAGPAMPPGRRRPRIGDMARRRRRR